MKPYNSNLHQLQILFDNVITLTSSHFIGISMLLHRSCPSTYFAFGLTLKVSHLPSGTPWGETCMTKRFLLTINSQYGNDNTIHNSRQRCFELKALIRWMKKNLLSLYTSKFCSVSPNPNTFKSKYIKIQIHPNSNFYSLWTITIPFLSLSKRN